MSVMMRLMAALLTGLVFLHVAQGQDLCTSTNGIIVTNSTVASDVAQCENVTTDVWIAPSQPGQAISLDGLKSVGLGQDDVRSLNCLDCTNVTKISSDSLKSVTAWLHIGYGLELTNISLPVLEFIGQAISLDGLPALQHFQLANEVAVGTVVGGVCAFIRNTSLSKVDGLCTGSAGFVVLVDNPKLESVQLLPTIVNYTDLPVLPTDWGLPQFTVTGKVTITNNSASVYTELPNLSHCSGSMILGNCSGLSIPKLASVNGSLYMPNASFTRLTAPSLKVILGDLEINGSFSNLVLPALSYVDGNLNLNSSGIFDCDPFTKLHDGGFVGGDFSCNTARKATPVTNSTTGMTATSTAASVPTGYSRGATGGIAAGAVVGTLIIVGLVAFLILHRRRKTVRSNDAAQQRSEEHDHAELAFGRLFKRSELPASPNQVSELRGNHSFLRSTPVGNGSVTRDSSQTPLAFSSPSAIEQHGAHARLSGPEEVHWHYDPRPPAEIQ